MNRKSTWILMLVLSLPLEQATAQTVLTIREVIERAQGQSPAYKQAETEKETSYWRYRSYKTNYNPQLRLNGNLPTYNQLYSPVVQEDGSIVYRPVNQINPGVNLGLFQPIQWTGGNISANTSLNYFSPLTTDSTRHRQWNGTVMNIQLTQPIFAFNPWKWDKKTQPLAYEESKRSFVEQREFISREAVNRFFDVLTAQINMQIAKFNLANNDTIYKIEQGRYNIGMTSQDKLLQVQLQLLRSRQDVAQSNLDSRNSSLQLRTFIGLQNAEGFTLILPEDIPLFDVTEEEGLRFAKENRAAFVAFERRRIEAERDVAQAKGRRFQTSLTAAYGLNNTSPYAGDLYSNPQKQQQVNVTFNVPIIDWGRNRSMMQTAYANKKLNDYIIAQDEVNFEQEIITQVRQFEMLRLQIEITKKSDEVAQERYNVAQNRYLVGKIDITNLNIALTEKDAAKRSYVLALKSFWMAYYDLRRLTLYDFANHQLLYSREKEDR